jgi:hypothetical protein
MAVSVRRIDMFLSRCSMLLLCAGLCLAVEAPGFKVTKRYPVPSDGGFD